MDAGTMAGNLHRRNGGGTGMTDELLNFVSSLRQYQIDPEVRDELLEKISSARAPAQCALPPENLPELLDTIGKLMNQIEVLRDAVNATLNWYGNDRLIQFPGKQLADALSAFTSPEYKSQAKATKGKAGMAGGDEVPVRRSTAGTGLQVGEASADLPATSEHMDVTARRDGALIEPQRMREAPYGKHRVQHEGMTLECNYFVPGLTLHDLTMLFEKATKSEGASEYAADPSKWPVVRGVQAVAEACIAALTRPECGKETR
jgi:hypothetical protein